MVNRKQKNGLERIGGRISEIASDFSAHPFAQIGFIVVCGLWFAGGFATDLLTAVLSIMAITLTQMVLNRQNEREMDAHRRDVAMHAKLDELIIASQRARNEVVGIEEEMDEEDIEELKHHALEAIKAVSDDAATDEEREAAKTQVEEAHERLTKGR